ncbi:unnamed protein product [Schistosoma margrebowiei]|uniref:Uncharacterized protein n=1 Tax=Schistosoma margrebowiei TaxID=48269 RepID=A0A183M488_9TREM|nr:unnamed protein product [Schistosoma margrebowiei]
MYAVRFTILSTQSTSDPLAKHYQQKPTMGENKPDPSGGSDQQKALEVDRTYSKEGTQLHHSAGPHREPSRSKGERKTREHNRPKNGDRHEKNEQQLDGTRKQGPVQSGLEIASRRPLLHWE